MVFRFVLIKEIYHFVLVRYNLNFEISMVFPSFITDNDVEILIIFVAFFNLQNYVLLHLFVLFYISLHCFLESSRIFTTAKCICNHLELLAIVLNVKVRLVHLNLVVIETINV